MEDEGNLNKFRVGPHPTLFYIPDFITDYQQTQLLNNIYQAPVSKWKSLKNRRLQNWGGVVHEKGLLAQDLPTWLTRITERIFEESGLFPSAINHVLINEYLPNQGIMYSNGYALFPNNIVIFHIATPGWACLFSVVAILSLGSPVYLHGIKDSEVQQYDKVVNDIEALEQHRLDPLFSGSDIAVEVMRNGELRSIQRTTTRISLTCRLVLKAHKNLFKF
ncbi:hypothetical protein AAG906_025774 [Vitis piasezkii]